MQVDTSSFPWKGNNYAHFNGIHNLFCNIRNPDKSNVVVLIVLNMGGMLPVSVVDSFQTGAMFDFATQWKDAAAKKFHESN